MDWPALTFNLLRLGLLLAGLILPGSMLLRALRLPWSLAAAFAASAATLYLVVLLFACTGVALSLFTLGAGLGLVTVVARLVPTRPSSVQLSSSFACFSNMGAWLPLYLAFWAVVAWRLGTQPLSGPDVYFRWSYLAEQMLRFGSLDFYPAHTAADFTRYFWAESIPPGIAGLYAWAYACAGSYHALWTSPVVALQLLALHELIWRLGSRWGGEVIARRAVLLAAACPLLTWSFLIGQETGLLAVAVTGLVWSLSHTHEADGARWSALSGIFAVVAASAREYGPVFAVAAVVAAKLLQLPRRRVLILALVALPMACAWPLRVWLRTGNPLYSLDLFGMLAVNPVFTAWNDSFRAPHAGIGWSSLGRYFLLWALPATAGMIALVALLVARLREARLVAGFVGLVFALWLVSVAYTAGGLFYSLRVLAPGFALLMVVASYGAGYFIRHAEAAKYLALAVGLVSLEALPKTLLLPENPYRVAVRDWPAAGGEFPASVRAQEEALVAKLKSLPGRSRVLSDLAALPRVLAAINTEVLPLWSPEVAWLFDGSARPEEVAQRWRKSGLRYVIIAKSGPTPDFFRTHARWRAPWFTLKPVAETETAIILEAAVAAPPMPAAKE